MPIATANMPAIKSFALSHRKLVHTRTPTTALVQESIRTVASLANGKRTNMPNLLARFWRFPESLRETKVIDRGRSISHIAFATSRPSDTSGRPEFMSGILRSIGSSACRKPLCKRHKPTQNRPTDHTASDRTSDQANCPPCPKYAWNAPAHRWCAAVLNQVREDAIGSTFRVPNPEFHDENKCPRVTQNTRK